MLACANPAVDCCSPPPSVATYRFIPTVATGHRFNSEWPQAESPSSGLQSTRFPPDASLKLVTCVSCSSTRAETFCWRGPGKPKPYKEAKPYQSGLIAARSLGRLLLFKRCSSPCSIISSDTRATRPQVQTDMEVTSHVQVPSKDQTSRSSERLVGFALAAGSCELKSLEGLL